MWTTGLLSTTWESYRRGGLLSFGTKCIFTLKNFVLLLCFGVTLVCVWGTMCGMTSSFRDSHTLGKWLTLSYIQKGNRACPLNSRCLKLHPIQNVSYGLFSLWVVLLSVYSDVSNITEPILHGDPIFPFMEEYDVTIHHTSVFWKYLILEAENPIVCSLSGDVMVSVHLDCIW